VCVCVFACAVFVCCFFLEGRISCRAVVAASESKLYILFYSVGFFFPTFKRRMGWKKEGGDGGVSFSGCVFPDHLNLGRLGFFEFCCCETLISLLLKNSYFCIQETASSPC
jgi:hypothetical protein